MERNLFRESNLTVMEYSLPRQAIHINLLLFALYIGSQLVFKTDCPSLLRLSDDISCIRFVSSIPPILHLSSVRLSVELYTCLTDSRLTQPFLVLLRYMLNISVSAINRRSSTKWLAKKTRDLGSIPSRSPIICNHCHTGSVISFIFVSTGQQRFFPGT